MRLCTVVLFLSLSVYSCSSGGGGFTSKLFPSGLSITSPTTPEASSSANTSLRAIGAFDSTQSFAQKRVTLESLASGSDACTFVFPSFAPVFNEPACYGPALYYQNHPDDPMRAEAPCTNQPWPCHPSGDLGIFLESEGEQACAAAKLNTEVGNVGQKVDAALLFVAGISCLIQRDGDLDTPKEGQSLDLTSALTEALAENNPTLTISSATLARLTDASDGLEVFQYAITANDNSGRAFSINLKHHPTDASGKNFKGKLWSSYETDNRTEFITANSFAFSLLYERSENDLNYRMLSTAYTNGLLSDFDQGMFDSNNDIDPTACPDANCWEDFAQTIGNIDLKTGLGSASYGWQAGTNDSDGDTKLARVFNVYTTEEDNVTKGYAFFGYGRGFDQSTGSIGSNGINRFICNWAGPNPLHAGLENRAQKQLMTFDESSGLFKSTAVNISYAPTNACAYDEGSNSFAFSTDPGVDLSLSANRVDTIANDLINLTTDADFANYPAPTVPVEDF